MGGGVLREGATMGPGASGLGPFAPEMSASAYLRRSNGADGVRLPTEVPSQLSCVSLRLSQPAIQKRPFGACLHLSAVQGGPLACKTFWKHELKKPSRVLLERRSHPKNPFYTSIHIATHSLGAHRSGGSFGFSPPKSVCDLPEPVCP